MRLPEYRTLSTTAASSLPVMGLGLLLLVQTALAQELRIHPAMRQGANMLVIPYDAQAASTYVLLQGNSASTIATSVATNSGPAGPAQFLQTIAAGTRESYFRIQLSGPPKPVVLDPAPGASEIGVTVRPKATFPKAVLSSSLNSANFFASFAGRKLAATIVPANDGTFAWLFLDPPMPSASQIVVTVDGSSIRTQDGAFLDADADGTPGGSVTANFSTVSVVPVPGTVISSRVVDPGADLIPRTADDVTLSANGFNYLWPIQGVKVFVLGMENNAAYTDATGRFTLTNVPVGDVKVVLDGRTAQNPPAGYYFPEMVMDTTISPGVTNGVMTARDVNGEVMRDGNGAPVQALAMYLPRVASNVLQTVNAGVSSLITLRSNAAYNLPPAQQSYMTLEVPQNSLIGLNGQPLPTGQVGVSVVPPELVRDMLPPGLLQHTFDITVQAPGVATFATPAPMTFPNVFHAPPGTKLNFLSFDHTTGRLVIDGTATVSSDGLTVGTDPGTGVTHPGWHGLTPPGVNGSGGGAGGGGGGGGGGGCPNCPPPTKPKNCDKERNLAISAGVQCAAGVTAAIPKSIPLVGCAIGFGLGIAGTIADCTIDFDGCERSIGLNTVGTLLGCIPVAGGALGAIWGCGLQAGTSLIDYNGCREVIGLAAVLPVPLQIQRNIFFEQQALWAAAADVYAIVLGDAKWTVIDPQDLLKAQAIFQALQDGIQPSSPGAERLVQSERDAILQLPLPSGISALDVGALVDRFDQLMSGQVLTKRLDLAALAAAGSKLVQVATELQSRGWLTSYDAYLRGIPDLAAQQDQALAQAGLAAAATGSPSPLVAGAFYKLTDLSNNFVQRGRMPATGRFDQLFLAADSFYSLNYVDPASGWTALTAFRTGPSGSALTMPRAIFVKPSSPDTDGDGLSDEAEEILGTDPTKFSTCGDGISDGAKVEQGLDLANCLPPPTGITASVALAGQAKKVALAGSTSEASELTAYLACGSRGLSIVNVTKFQAPILLGQLDLPGDAVDVAVDSALKIAAVAALGGGLHLVDVSDPQQPKLLRTIQVNAQPLQAFAGIVYAGVDSAINAYDLATGELLQSLHAGSESLTGLAREGLFLYTMDRGLVLRTIDITGPLMAARGSLTMTNGGGTLFVGSGIAYIPAAETRFGGYATASVSDADHPKLISGSNTGPPSLGPNAAFVANGSGIGLLLGDLTFVGLGGSAVLDVMNVSNPAATTTFLARFTLPAAPFDAAIGAGVAFVADGTAGLQVVNYLALDTEGVPPVLSISTSSTNALEGSLLPVRIQVSDDVQVRNVELLVDGQVVRNVVSFPFDLTAELPRLASSSGTVVIQARATDTGGNSRLSAPITIHLVADNIPPALLSVDPANNTTRGLALRTVTVRFSEPIDPRTVNAQSIELLSTNGPVLPQVIQFRLDGAIAQLTYPPLRAGDYQIVIHGPSLQDRAGNSLGATQTTNRFSIGTGGLAVWVYPSDGFWDVPANWESGVVPGPTDDVLIAVPGNATVTVRQGTHTIHSLVSSNALTIAGGRLTVATTVQVNNVFTLTGGTLAGATVLRGAGGEGVILTSGLGGLGNILDGLTLDADATIIGATYGTWTVVNGLTVNGTLTLASPRTSMNLEFKGTQRLDGKGDIRFNGCCVDHIYAINSESPVLPATLTIGSGITVHGPGSGTVQNTSPDDRVVNLGTIAADAPKSTITFGNFNTPARAALNQGTLQALNGGTLDTFSLENAGTISIGSGGTLILETGWNNSGTLTLDGGTVNLGDSFSQSALGTFNRTGGTVNIVGILTGGLKLDATTGSWNIKGRATISGGTITTSGGAQLIASLGTFSGVTLSGDVIVPDAGFLSIDKGLTLASGTITLDSLGSPTYLIVKAGGQTIGGTGQIAMLGSTTSNILLGGDGNGPSALTIGPNVMVRGRGGFTEYSTSTLINQGIIQADIPGKQLDIEITSVTNTGSIQSTGGGMFYIGNFGASLVNAGQLTPGNPPNVMTVTGTYAQQSPGIVNLHIGGTTPGTQFSQIQMTGPMALDGTLNLILVNGYEPNLGDTFRIVTYTSATGQFAVINGAEIGHGKRFSPKYDATGLTLTVVPSP